jgi:hypothetical protein
MPRLIDDRPERLAVLFDDVEKMDPVLRTKLFGANLERLDVNGRVEVEDSPALVLSCPILQAALIIDLARNYNREEGVKPLRCWLDKGQGWQRVPGKNPLTLIIKGSTALNPAVFDEKVDAPGLLAESIL